ncbi:hypothetical protein Sste5344_009330 [Sporothrix stenoceras]
MRGRKTDTDQADADGNTLFHRAALGPFDDESIAELTARATAFHVNADQPNHAGRTPLHVLCCYDWYDDMSPRGSGYTADPIRRFLQYVRHIDTPDARGVRPLHMAAMLSEVCVGELLAAGADPEGATSQGLTPLHLAARARQSNIVGSLLDAIRIRGGPTAHAAAVCAVDEVGWQPLHYACRSGRPETVALLLGGGGGIDAATLSPIATFPSLLDACAEFAQEQPLWESYHRPTAEDAYSMVLVGLEDGWRDDVVGGVERHDQLRPWVTAGRLILDATAREIADGADEDTDIASLEETMINLNGEVRTDQDTTQLRPILQMLYQAHKKDQAAAPDSFLHSLRTTIQKIDAPATSPTSETFHAYTLQCFRDFASDLEREKVVQARDSNSDNSVNDDDLIAIEESSDGRDWWGPLPWGGERIVGRVLRQREFNLIPRFLLRWATPEPPHDHSIVHTKHGPSTHRQEWLSQSLRSLVELGQADVLAAACAKASPDNPLFRDAETVGTYWSDPLLYLACCRELPNMDVIRLLVETCHADVNGRTMTIAERAKARIRMLPEGTIEEEDPVPGHETPLFALARGYHWWGTALAIPYLITHGADVTAKNEWGQTALDIAKYGREDEADRPHTKRVFELLRGES